MEEKSKKKKLQDFGVASIPTLFLILSLTITLFLYDYSESAGFFYVHCLLLTSLLALLSACLFYEKYRIRAKIRWKEIAFLLISIIVVYLFFLVKDAPKSIDDFEQMTVANLGTFFGGILTPIGIFFAVWGTTNSSIDRDAKQVNDMFEYYNINISDKLYRLEKISDEWLIVILSSNNQLGFVDSDKFVNCIGYVEAYINDIDSIYVKMKTVTVEEKMMIEEHKLQHSINLYVAKAKREVHHKAHHSAILINMASYLIECHSSESQEIKLNNIIEKLKKSTLFEMPIIHKKREAMRLLEEANNKKSNR